MAGRKLTNLFSDLEILSFLHSQVHLLCHQAEGLHEVYRTLEINFC